MEQSIIIAALTPKGAALARRLREGLGNAICRLPRRFAQNRPEEAPFDRVAEVFQEAFFHQHPLVCIMAAGIVVRGIAPYLQSKGTDPLVVVVDEAGKFAVSLLSGHLGGANDLARRVALILGGQAVITTATDVNDLPALDVLAPRLGLVMENLDAVRDIHMALLEGEPVRLVDQEGCLTEALQQHPGLFARERDLAAALGVPGPGVYVGYKETNWPPAWLRLRPRVLVAGLGCHQGTPAEEVLNFLRQIFKREGLSLRSLKALATIEARKDAPGLKAAARELGVDLLWFSADSLKNIEAPNPSPAAARHLGVASVCEAAAMKAAGGPLIVTKCKSANVTLAVARAA
ncbi:MAG: cobalt-precorrin 5A hydrolase [Deltaproteobacteria bacterium]|nr:cobalt-precorrin 5A hydrolase [Deltaproteobacteria bacterium]